MISVQLGDRSKCACMKLTCSLYQRCQIAISSNFEHHPEMITNGNGSLPFELRRKAKDCKDLMEVEF